MTWRKGIFEGVAVRFRSKPSPPRPEAVAAAAWWADAALGRVRGTTGSAEVDGGLAVADAFAGRSNRADEGVVERFEALLVEELTSALERGLTIVLRCDYGPEGELARIANAAGVHAPFPRKTTMWVEAGSVAVVPGYHRPEVQVYPAKPASAETSEAS